MSTKLELAELVVSLPDWEWLPGTKDTSGRRVCGNYETVSIKRNDAITRHYASDLDGSIPDFDDPLTEASVGVLVKRAWGEANVRCGWVKGKGWVIDIRGMDVSFTGPTELHAQVQALWAAGQ